MTRLIEDMDATPRRGFFARMAGVTTMVCSMSGMSTHASRACWADTDCTGILAGGGASNSSG